jgi:DNA-binding MarR family transcriptional regulator
VKIREDDDHYRFAARRLSTTLARVLRELSRDFDRRVTHLLHQRGHTSIGLSHRIVFNNLGLGRTRVSELAERAQITQQAMGKTLRELENLGYVERVVDDTDRRARAIRLTPQGVQFIEDAVACIDEVRAGFAEKIGERELDELEAQLRQAAHKLELNYLPPDWARVTD